jgi:hypothetical protein
MVWAAPQTTALPEKRQRVPAALTAPVNAQMLREAKSLKEEARSDNRGGFPRT